MVKTGFESNNKWSLSRFVLSRIFTSGLSFTDVTLMVTVALRVIFFSTAVTEYTNWSSPK